MAIFPTNDSALVQAVLDRLDVSPDQVGFFYGSSGFGLYRNTLGFPFNQH